MVKKLWLLRHGHAQHAAAQKDFERTLTPEGKDRIEQVGKQVRSVCDPNLILCSSARRTCQTADCFLAQLANYGRIQYVDAIYEASYNKLLSLLNGQKSQHQSILLIGHNPGISLLTDLLTGQSFNNLSPGDLVELEFTGFEWNEVGEGTGILRNR